MSSPRPSTPPTPLPIRTRSSFAPQFYSEKLNSGQYKKHELAWDDINAWQAGEAAIHPTGSKETSFDALDAFADEFTNTTKYPALEELVFVGHGGGGQLINRYGVVAKEMSTSRVQVRFIAGDPSSSAYFTEHRPTTNAAIADKASCPLYNTWRYGFDNFTVRSTGSRHRRSTLRRTCDAMCDTLSDTTTRLFRATNTAWPSSKAVWREETEPGLVEVH